MEILLSKVDTGGVFFMRKQRKTIPFWKRFILFFAAVFTVAAAFKTLVYRAMVAQTSISGVFRTLELKRCEGKVTFTARIPGKDRRQTEKRLISGFAGKIGLVPDMEPRCVNYTGREEHIYEKEAAQASSVLKYVRLTEEGQDYLCAEITLYDADPSAAEELKETMEKAAKRYGLTEVSATIELTGSCPGELPLGVKDRLTDTIFHRMYAGISYENRQNDNYTVYGYTAAEKNYLTVGGKKVNLQTAIYYDPETDRTEVVIASPVGLR